MNRELSYNFLYNTNEFTEQFKRVLERTPHERNAGKVDFWIYFFSSIGVTIQNTQLNQNNIHIQDIAFSIDNVPRSTTKILKLAFKVNDNGQDIQDKVILRSISIGEDNDILERSHYSDTELTKIKRLLSITTSITENIVTTDSQTLHLNIKTDYIKLETNNILGKSRTNFVKIQPLQLQEDETLDTTLDLIAIPAPIDDKATFQNNVETFFNKLTELYNSNKKLLQSEVSYHGFMYGLLALNYKNKYAIDTYVEQSAGRGFLDLYFLLRKDKYDRDISNAVKIITEFKGKGNLQAVTDAKNQLRDRVYDQLVGRTTSEDVAIVATDFGSSLKKVIVEVKNIEPKQQNFVSRLIGQRQEELSQDDIKQEIKAIYDSTRSDESVGLVILGELLSSNVKKDVFIIKALPNNQRVSIFVFNNQEQKSVILTIIERANLDESKYERTFYKDPSKRVTRQSTTESKQVTIEEEVRDGILHIQKELNINADKIIYITINPKGNVFESKSSADFYCLEIQVNDGPLKGSQAPYISQFITNNNIQSNIDIDNLIPELQSLALGQISQHKALDTLKEELFKLNNLITSEKDFKSVLHGLFLHKKFNEKNIKILTEVSVGHGRTDLVLIFDDGQILAVELKHKKHGVSQVTSQESHENQQLQEYIKYLKVLTDKKEVSGIILQYNVQASESQKAITSKSLTSTVLHSSADEGGQNPIKQSRIRSGEIHEINVEEILPQFDIGGASRTSGVHSGVKRKISIKDKSPIPKKKAIFDADEVNVNLKLFHEFRQASDEISLEASAKSCATSSSRKRKTRAVCQEEDLELLYDPLEEHIQESIKINSRSYINLAYLFSLQHRDNMPENIKLDNVISYAKNIGDIINEGEVNRSTREQELLKTYYQEAQKFFSKYSKDNLFDLVTTENKPSLLADSSYLFTNGQQTLLVSSYDNYYQLYSQDYNYQLLFQTQEDLNFLYIKNLATKFFQWLSGGNTEYKIFTLSKNLPQDVIVHLTQAPFWTPDNVVSDLVLLNKEHAGSIESIPSEVVRELFFLNNKALDIKLLDQDFFQLNKEGITFRADILHKVLPSLTEQQIQALGDVIKKYDLSLDTQCLDLIPESNKNLLQNYNHKILNQLKSSEVLNLDKITQLSWETLNHEFENGSFEGINYKDILPKERREKSLNYFKDLHDNAHSKFHALQGAVTQGAFLLPDIIRSFNTGDPEGLIKTVGMISGDMLLDRTLFSELPIQGLIFKVVTLYSIGTLHNKLNSLPPDSEEATIIKHQLGEQYFAVGLMLAEMYGFETGPLWIALMAEQMLYGAIALRNQYHLPDTSLWEAFLINLGFYQDELPIIFEERHLLEIQLKFLDGLNFPSAWIILYLPDVQDIRWITVQDIPDQVQNYIKDNVDSVCSAKRTDTGAIGLASWENPRLTCEYYGFRKEEFSFSSGKPDSWQQQIFDINPKNRDIKFVPTKIHQEHNVFQNIEYPSGQRIYKGYHRIASQTIEDTNDPDVGLAQVAKIDGGMSAIYFNLTTWKKCLSDNEYVEPCSTSQSVWLNGPYRHNMIMLFDPKVHSSNTNIYFHHEGLNHLDENYFSHVNNEYLANKEYNKCATDLNDYCFEHLKSNIPDTYSLLIVLYNFVYPNTVNFIRTTNNTKLRINNHNTTINTNYIIDANLLKQVVPFKIYDHAHNMSITLSNIREDNIISFALWQQKLSSKNLGTSGYGIYFNSEEKLIIPGYKDSIAILIIQPMGWYIDELILSVKYCNIINAIGRDYSKPGKIILEKIAAHDHSFDIQLIGNIHIIDKNSKMELSIIGYRADKATIKYSKLPSNQFIIESCDNLQPFSLDESLRAAVSVIQTIKENTISFVQYHTYTLKFFGNNMITIRGILDYQPSELELIIHNGKLYECILSVLPNNNELFIIEHVHYDQKIILAQSELDLTEIIEHKSHDIPTFRDQSYIAKYLKNGIMFIFYYHGNIIKHHFLTKTPSINNITYSIKDGNVLCAKIENKHTIMNKDFIWYKSTTIADNKKCLEFSTDIQNVSIVNGTLNINGVNIVDIPKKMGIVTPSNIIMPLSFFHNLVGINIIPQAEDQLEELLSSSVNPRFRRAIKEEKQNSEEAASVTIDEQQINMNDELANSNTYNVARSSASILEPSFSFNNGLWSWVWNKLVPEADAATLDKSKSFNDNDIYKLIKQFNNHPSDTQIKKQNHETEAENNNIDNSKSSLSDYLLIDDPGNDQGNLQTVINSIDIPSNLSLLTLLIGQFFGINKALSSNPYISPEQEKNRYINELSKIVKSAISEMETKYDKRYITNEELEDILPSLNVLFNGQEELNYNNNSTSVIGRTTEICNHVYDFFGYETN